MYSVRGKGNERWAERDMVTLQGAGERWLPQQLVLPSTNISLQVWLNWVAIQFCLAHWGENVLLPSASAMKACVP